MSPAAMRHLPVRVGHWAVQGRCCDTLGGSGRCSDWGYGRCTVLARRARSPAAPVPPEVPHRSHASNSTKRVRTSSEEAQARRRVPGRCTRHTAELLAAQLASRRTHSARRASASEFASSRGAKPAGGFFLFCKCSFFKLNRACLPLHLSGGSMLDDARGFDAR